MKRNFLFFVLTLIAINSFGQINFENGYFINNNNQRIECLIKNSDWINNPVEFEYKLTANAKAEKGTLSTAKEFGVTAITRYIRADVKIDISPADIDNFYRERNPEWSQERLYLKVLVEGKAMLYYYEKNGLVGFFYSVSDTIINQLIYKEYYAENNQIAENFKFREQLWSNVRCANTQMNSVENIRYNTSELEQYFNKYNRGEGNLPVVYGKKERKDSFHLKISPGINYSSVIIANTGNERYNTAFNNQINFRMGLEAEFIMPFNMNKWGILFEPSFQYFNAEKQTSTTKVTLHSNSIEFPVGLRYYAFLNQKLKLFADAMYIPQFSIGFNSTLVHQTTISSILPTTMELKNSQSYALGGGIGYKKYSAELRYYTNRDIFNGYMSWYSDYQKFALILGYRIL